RWLVRRYMGKDANGVGRYQERDLGLADDHLDADADGKTILNFKHAQKLANEWRRDNDGGTTSPNGPLTVRDALDRYFPYLEQEGRPTADARLRTNLHILPSLGKELIDTLSTERLRRWFADLAKLPPQHGQPHFDDLESCAQLRFRRGPRQNEPCVGPQAQTVQGCRCGAHAVSYRRGSTTPHQCR